MNEMQGSLPASTYVFKKPEQAALGMPIDDFQVWLILLSLQVSKKDTNGTNGTLEELVVWLSGHFGVRVGYNLPYL